MFQIAGTPPVPICFALERITISSEQFIAAHRTKLRLSRSWEVQAYGRNVRIASAHRDLALEAPGGNTKEI
jgi:hypothetical protein